MSTERKKQRDSAIDQEAALLVAAIVRVRISQGQEPTVDLLISETVRMAHYLHDVFGSQHFRYMVDYDGVIDLLRKDFLKDE